MDAVLRRVFVGLGCRIEEPEQLTVRRLNHLRGVEIGQSRAVPHQFDGGLFGCTASDECDMARGIDQTGCHRQAIGGQFGDEVGDEPRVARLRGIGFWKNRCGVGIVAQSEQNDIDTWNGSVEGNCGIRGRPRWGAGGGQKAVECLRVLESGVVGRIGRDRNWVYLGERRGLVGGRGAVKPCLSNHPVVAFFVVRRHVSLIPPQQDDLGPVDAIQLTFRDAFVKSFRRGTAGQGECAAAVLFERQGNGFHEPIADSGSHVCGGGLHDELKIHPRMDLSSVGRVALAVWEYRCGIGGCRGPARHGLA